MADPTKPPGFWQTLPGILTATAALVTALVGGYVALRQVSGPDNRAASPAAEARPVPAEPGAAAPASDPETVAASDVEAVPEAAAGPAGPWADAEAVITRTDGDVLVVGAETLHVYGDFGLSLRSGQQIPFERMQSFAITQAPSADVGAVTITLHPDGRTVQGRIDLGSTFYGSNDLGEVTGHLNDVSRVDFRR